MKKFLVLSLLCFLVFSCKKTNSKQDEEELEKEYKAELAIDPSFEISKDYQLTKLKSKKYNKEEQNIHLKDKKGNTIFSFQVHAKDYIKNGGGVYEIKNPNLDNVEKVICVLISQCFCGCTDEYHYILKHIDGTYSSLPKLTSEGKEIYPVFTYRFGRLNVIEEIETTFKVEKNEVVTDEIMVVSELVWDGEEVIND